jgi:hypothetical protein
MGLVALALAPSWQTFGMVVAVIVVVGIIVQEINTEVRAAREESILQFETLIGEIRELRELVERMQRNGAP